MLKIYLIDLSAIIVLCLVFWLAYLKTKLPSVIDVGWGLGIGLGGMIYLCSGDFQWKSFGVGVLLLIWSLRLSGYLYWTRIHVKEVDQRYLDISDAWDKKSLYFLGNFIFQGFLMSLIALPFYFISTQPANGLDPLEVFGTLLVVIGLVGESLADWQLYQYKKNPKTKVCRKGLWRYSRHPNYFFEWLVWIGFALFGYAASYGIFSFISPLVLLYIMTVLTGPITERASLNSRGRAFKLYQNDTSAFFPWIPKR